jgi:cobalt-zinc-cadmium resistance protein CzcA
MIEALVRWSMRHRGLVLAGTGVAVVLACIIALRLRFDALPDVTSNQVLVLTRAPGLTPEEVERLVTRPLETALGGVPGVQTQRSLSRYALSSVTVVFADDVDPYRARQVVQERVSLVSLPAEVEAPELGPLTGGLGEIYHFAVTGPGKTGAALLELVQLQIAPRLREVPGVVEVNWWGGRQRSLDAVARPTDLARLRVTLPELLEALRLSIGSAPGASVPAGSAQTLLRAVAWPHRPEDLAAAVVRPATATQALVRVGDVADVEESSVPRIGAATADGRGETVYVMVQMLRDDNALEVVQKLHAQMPKVRAMLPAGVTLHEIYDRGDLVHRTLNTVGKNLAEGGLLVVVVLLALLGSLRAGLLVALVIPLSMLGAAVGMVGLGIAGNLMSLGAIDFGLLVDGAVVMVEGLAHALELPVREGETDAEQLERVAVGVARPVFFSVLVILLVYVPVLTLSGVDGKMFRPMAATVLLALTTALVLSLTFVPAAATFLLKRSRVPSRPPWLVRVADRVYAPLLAISMRHPVTVAALALVLLAGGGVLLQGAGTAFVPQLDEGDLVVQTTRSPDISLESAVDAASRMEAALLLRVPEVAQVVSRIGSPAVATDIMGLEQADVFVRLKPPAQWRPGLDRDTLIAQMQALLTRVDPTAESSFTQPIQMRFNELLGGSVTDVDVSVFGEDLTVTRRVAEQIASVVKRAPGATDVRVLAPPDVSLLEVVPQPMDVAQFGMTARDVLDAVQAVRQGVTVGQTYDGPVRLPVRVRLAGTPNAFTLGQVLLPTSLGALVPLQRVAHISTRATPGLVSRESGQRRLVVGFNVRGGDLGEVVVAAQALVHKNVRVPAGMRLDWGGQWETFAAARQRIALVVPLVLLLILGVLVLTFHRLGPALVLLLNVPFAGVGGVALLVARELPVSISAAIGFIALSGIAVLNGVVLMTRMLELRADGLVADEAASQAARSRLRPVLMTALVAMLGFVPMMLAQGAGAEVQRPLATVVVGGLLSSTALTLLVLPTLTAWLWRREWI